MADDFQVLGNNNDAQFSLKLHRGEGMCLLAMDWRAGKPPKDFVGFAIQFTEPGGTRLLNVRNRLAFPGTPKPKAAGKNPALYPSMQQPFQKFRWAHFPFNANLAGAFNYRVTPVFMNANDELTYGLAQEAKIVLARHTHRGLINIAFTRGFVSSQAFVDRYEINGAASKTLLPKSAKVGLSFVPTHPQADEALAWMGFEATSEIRELIKEASADPAAQVFVIAYDLNLPELVEPLEKLGGRVKIIIDDSKDHKPKDAAETIAAGRLVASAGAGNVKRQHMDALQHNKIIIVDSPAIKKVVCGSTNFSWRGFYVQNNNAVVIEGQTAVTLFREAFDHYWANDTVDGFGATSSAVWASLGLQGIDAKVTFSPHIAGNAVLQSIADDIDAADSSVLYSLAFLFQTGGAVHEALARVTAAPDIFVYGISDEQTGIELQKPDGTIVSVGSAVLAENVPPPFSKEPLAGSVGTRMHHKFVVLDFDKPTARVYTGSYNVSGPADISNGENLLLIKDRRIVTSYMIEALRMFDHYHFRTAQLDAAKAKKKLELKRPPRQAGEQPWWTEYYADPVKIRDRGLFG
jgi:hypothetical protein